MKIKYIKKDKYCPSTLKNCKSFISKVKEEASQRQIVEVDGKKVIFGVEGPIILREGKLWSISACVENGKWGKHYITIYPNLESIIEKGECFIRLDSGCISGMLGDTTCDCMEQLKKAQQEAIEKGGVIIHIPDQDGRGHKELKMANQRIMAETKLDTIVVATKFYGCQENIDIRTFDEAALILKALGFPKDYKFNLGTKNPKKANALLQAGFSISTHAIKVNGKSKDLTKNLEAKYKFFNNQERIAK